MLVLSILVPLLLSLHQFSYADVPTQSPAYVQVRTAALRKGPQQWSNALVQLAYGSEVSIVDTSAEPWLVVKAASGEQGYLHRSALSAQKIVFLKTATKSDLNDASMSNVVLAGKGFSEDVEDLYSQNNPNLDMKLIDEIELQNSKARLVLGAFVSSGRLKGPSGNLDLNKHSDAQG